MHPQKQEKVSTIERSTRWVQTFNHFAHRTQCARIAFDHTSTRDADGPKKTECSNSLLMRKGGGLNRNASRTHQPIDNSSKSACREPTTAHDHTNPHGQSASIHRICIYVLATLMPIGNTIKTHRIQVRRVIHTRSIRVLWHT